VNWPGPTSELVEATAPGLQHFCQRCFKALQQRQVFATVCAFLYETNAKQYNSVKSILIC